MTPNPRSQLQQDLFPRDKLAVLVLDDNHNLFINNDLVHHGRKPRIPAMTAIPGETEEAWIFQICRLQTCGTFSHCRSDTGYPSKVESCDITTVTIVI
jgi:hypothetical protein